MKIYLFSDHTAAALDDRSQVVKTDPESRGVLTVAGVSVHVTEEGGPMPVLSEKVGHITGEYISDSGIRYPIRSPVINRNGVPVSKLEERETMLTVLLRLDELAVTVSELEKKVEDLRGIYERDALWFLGKNKGM